jgi:hypothetical protein
MSTNLSAKLHIMNPEAAINIHEEVCIGTKQLIRTKPRQIIKC